MQKNIIAAQSDIWLSVVLPCFNVEPYLDDCFASLLNQEDISLSEYEILCINDGSTDNTLDKLRYYEESYPNIRVISTPNRGVSAARNTGIENAKGSYITFVDPDDAIQIDLFQNVKKILAKNAETDIVIGCLRRFNDDMFSERLNCESDYNDYFVIDDTKTLRDTYVLDVKTQIQQGIPCAQFFSKELLMNNELRFRENLSIGEDEVFNFEVKSVSKKVIFVPAVFYFYRLRLGSVMHGKTSILAKKRQNSNKIKALIYRDKCDNDPLARAPYIAAQNQTCFMLLFIKEFKYVKKQSESFPSWGFILRKILAKAV